MPKRLAACFAVLCLMVAFAIPTPAGAAGRGRDVIDIAHRGSSGSAPENTVGAMRFAVDHRASFVEIDVQRSADGKLVVMHDTTMARTTNAKEVFPTRSPWNIRDFTFAEIRQLDAGTWFSTDYAGERVPTLREIVEAVRGRAGLLLEIKAPELYPGIEAEIHKELQSIPGYLPVALRLGKFVVQSFNVDSLRIYHQIAPEVPLGILLSARPSEEVLVEASTWARQINPSYTVTDQALIQRVHELGMTISVYTPNTGQLMRQYIGLGVDGIITNYPGVLRDILGR
ncbi:hypothetical protein LZC95_29605 [Pendulispora brunnea]|uniref:GP-PDE domain-containing protein n=1 Tax=Pendulispora brunnea TaxID=2905690 RepID=A0ABZ2JVV7_9BACT